MAVPPPALVLGDDTGACLGAIRSLGRMGVPVHSAGWNTELPPYRSRYCVDVHRLALYEGDGSVWVARIRELIKANGIALLVPTSDASLAQLSVHAADFAPAIVAAPSPEALDLFGNKLATREAAQRAGVPVAEGLAISRESDTDAVIAALGLPLIVKSQRSYGLGDETQKSPVSVIETRADLARRLAMAGDDLAEAFIPGFCRGVSVLATNGVVHQAFQHKRLRQKHDTGPSSSRISESLDPRLVGAVDAMVREARYSGIAMFEFRCQSDSDKFALLEVNPRAWGSMQLAMDAGADYVAAQYQMLIQGIEPETVREFATGLRKKSLWGEFEAISHAADASRGLAAKATCALEVAKFAWSLVTGAGFDSHAADDPKPFIAERAQLFARAKAKFLPKRPTEIAGEQVVER